MATARARGRGRIPRILMNGQAAAYSSRCRIGGSVTVSSGENGVKLRASGFGFRASAGKRLVYERAGGKISFGSGKSLRFLFEARKPKPEARVFISRLPAPTWLTWSGTSSRRGAAQLRLLAAR